MGHRRHTVLCVAPTGHQRAHEAADGKAGCGHGGLVAADDLAGHLEARQIGRARRHRVMTHALQHIGPVDPARRHANQQLARAGNRLGTLRHAQHLGGTERRDFNGFHGLIGLQGP